MFVVALIIGFVFGFVGSMPVAGPIAVLVLGLGLNSRFRTALYVAAGSAVAESGYAFMALWGLSTALERYPRVVPVCQALGAVILVVVGATLAIKPPAQRKNDEREVRPGSGLALGFVLTALNPTLLATWTGAVTALYATGLVSVSTSHAGPFAAGAGAGVISWFAVMVTLLRRGRDRVRPEMLQRFVRGAGIALIGLGLSFAIRLALRWHAAA